MGCQLNQMQPSTQGSHYFVDTGATLLGGWLQVMAVLLLDMKILRGDPLTLLFGTGIHLMLQAGDSMLV